MASTKKTLLVDTEGGFTSVADLIQAGSVVRVPARSYAQAEQAMIALKNGTQKADAVAIDTLDMLSIRARQGLVDDKKPGTIWEKRDKLTSSENDWGRMNDLMYRLLDEFENLLDLEVFQTLIITVHEGDRPDIATGIPKTSPDLNKGLLKYLVGYSDAIARLYRSTKAATIDGKTYPPGTRLLRIAENAETIAKTRGVMYHDVPEVIIEPTLAKLQGVLSAPARKIVIFGPPGAGKTTLSTSLSREESN